MEAGLELEYDAFFADLSKQISLLIMDDDESLIAHCPSVSLQALTQAIHPVTQASFLSYDQQTCYKRESKGTGVFIPRSLPPRRKNIKPGRFTTASGNKSQRPSDNKSTGLPHLAYNNISPSYYVSSNLGRF